MNNSTEKTTLYRYFDGKGQLLYVGITKNPFDRQAHHAANKDWWQDVERSTFEHYQTRNEAIAAEAYAIGTELPKYNKQGPVLNEQLRQHLLQIMAMDLQDSYHRDVSANVQLSMVSLARFSNQPEIHKLLFAFDRAIQWNKDGDDRDIPCQVCRSVVESHWYKMQLEQVDSAICDESVRP